MLGLTLRPEFQSPQMRGTQIVLTDYAGSEAARILDITYPTADVRKALLGVAQGQGRPVVIIGERGRGKSHIMAVLTAAFREPAAVQQWAVKLGGDRRQFGLRGADPAAGLCAVEPGH